MKRSAAWRLTAILLAGLAASLVAQNSSTVRISKGWRTPYQDPDDPKMKMVFSGDDMVPLTGDLGLIVVKGFRMVKFLDGDEKRPELIIEAPECFFEPRTFTVNSAGPIRAYTVSTNYSMEGVGFIWRSRTNVSLFISNSVHTVLEREPSTNSRPAGATAPIPTPLPTHVYSDRFQYTAASTTNREGRVAHYVDRVRVVDEQAELTADFLTAELPASGTNVSRLVAETNVVVLIRRDGSRATGDRAVYDTRQGRELVELTGNPTWGDSSRQAVAERFIYDRLRNEILATNHVRLRLPREASGDTFFGSATPASKPPSNSTNRFVEILAEMVWMTLPTTNRPGRAMVAERQVVIVTPDDQGRATGDKAVYSEATGRIDLTGDPVWRQGSNVVRGDLLSMVRSNRSFSAVGHAYVWLLADAVGLPPDLGERRSKNVAGPPGVKPPADTNLFIEVHSSRFDYLAATADFIGDVHAHLIREAVTNITLDAQLVSLHLSSNQVTGITAQRQVVLTQNPATSPNTNLLKRVATMDVLTLRRSPRTGLIETLAADGHVTADQWEKAGTNPPVHQSGRADLVVGQFNAKSNHLDGVMAERNVVVRKDGLELHGNRGTYVAGVANRVLEMSGDVWSLGSGFLFTNAPVLLWDLKNDKVLVPPADWKVQGTVSGLKKNPMIPQSDAPKTP